MAFACTKDNAVQIHRQLNVFYGLNIMIKCNIRHWYNLFKER